MTLKALKENQLIALTNEYPITASSYQQPPFHNNYHNIHQIATDPLLPYSIPPPNLNMPPPQSFYRA